MCISIITAGFLFVCEGQSPGYACHVKPFVVYMYRAANLKTVVVEGVGVLVVGRWSWRGRSFVPIRVVIYA